MYKILSVGSPPRTDAASIKTSATAGNIVVYLEIQTQRDRKDANFRNHRKTSIKTVK